MDSAALPPERLRLLSAVLDAIVPPREDGSLGGAGALGLTDRIERSLERTPDLRPAVVQGLDALDALARERSAGGFEALGADERAALLEELSGAQPAFLPGLVFQTYVAYYEDPRVLESLGIPGRPPHPEGYELEGGDLGIFERVRRRGGT
jgi:hypothetical protein